LNKHDSRHHIVPRSRGGKKTVKMSKRFHQSFHNVFGNLTPDEQVEFIKILTERLNTQKPLKDCELERLRRRAKR